MGDFADDAYEAIQMETFEFNNLVERLMRKIPHQKVVDLSIYAFRIKPVNDEKITECLARDILKTVSRQKRLSEKQKKCLIKVLIERNMINL
ncbi:hypothetical protein [Bacillus velezensis]|uniref:hypothetical protein n=1 Tax=Bacillus velezensis TaxID=492670 RepID=UPI001A935305|nr:hypothetical protein [Bacillus velezensis]BCT30326.1 hypothetical protein BVAD3_40000 [Bacillus velezensis]